MLNPALRFRHPSVTPPRKGLYVRDWRGTKVLPEWDRTLCVDLWIPERDQRSILFPGVWYVYPGVNDASVQKLPWRELTLNERLWFYNEQPEARAWKTA